MPLQTQTLALAALLGISVSSAAVCLYLLYRKEDDNYFAEKSLKPTAKHPIVVEVSVPKEVVGFVIGPQGSNIKHIQETTTTRINFKDEETATERIAVIRGNQADVQEAQRLVLKSIRDAPEIISQDMLVPQRACGRLIGKNGDTIRMINRTSGAKVNLPREITADRNPDTMRKVIIKGTADQISLAKSLIIEKLEEEEAFRQRQQGELSGSGKITSVQNQNLSIQSREQVEAGKRPRREKLVPTATDGFLETYISAVDTGGHFWLQPVGTLATELDRLDEEMSAYYNNPDNQVKHTTLPDKLKVGDLVAAILDKDEWYRAQVVSIEDDEYDPEQGRLTLYYVDFGDTRTVTRSQVCLLKDEYLRLPMQAIECFLANVKPTGDVWTEAATELFEKLSYCSQWKIIMARPVSYMPAPESAGDTAENSQSRDMVAVVDLVDTNGTVDVNVAAELVKQGHALWEIAPAEHPPKAGVA